MAIASSSSQDDPYLKALQQLTASGTTAGAANVYMGDEYAPTARDEKYGRTPRSVPRWATEVQATGEYYSWTPKQQSDFIAQGILSGLLKLGDGPMEGGALWKKLVKEAAQYGAAGQHVSPIDIMATYVKASGGANAWKSAGVWQINTQTGERKYVGPGTYLGEGKAQQIDTRVDLTDPDTARAVSTKLFQDLMGRDPGEGELTAFAGALSQAEQANPVVATTTTQYDMDTGQALSSDTTQSGGLTSEARAYIQEQQIKKKKEYGAFQAATTYEGALEALVFGSPG
jgi:hypothetical protein